ncbi:SUMF1/EgtB/PvdO family nonheme iron enzyme [uncultured Treponema sp.]|uniref:SUMF1/EgtB/PvdO family nonheme iron enzyme n=1 Tax=uncultured Treponema sp. TaxID=162155 RepID=UPI00258535F1|nr:SUMF1/EgtB/PvdO family nonheme iron enzyme [uncultured Treponema sp.]
MKRFLTVLVAALLLVPAFAQTTVDEGKLVKTLEKNKDEDASFASEIDLSRMKVYSDGEVSIPLFAKSKVNIVSDIDMIDIEIRMSNARKSRFNVLFKVKDIKSKTYKITRIAGIETGAEYRKRLEAERSQAEEKAAELRRQQEEKERLEAEAAAEAARKADLRNTVFVIVNLEPENLPGAEAEWIPICVRDNLRLNLRECLRMSLITNTEAESMFKNGKAQDKAEYALFTKVKKTSGGYSINAEFKGSDGTVKANVSSDEYPSAEDLFAPGGAVDKLSLLLADSLNIPVEDFMRDILLNKDFEGNELFNTGNKADYFNWLVNDSSNDMERIGSSGKLNDITDRIRIKNDKELFAQKLNAAEKQKALLEEQDKRKNADSELDEKRGDALKARRAQIEEAVAKAAAGRKSNTGIRLITTIEAKKKALSEIRQSVENECIELHDKMKLVEAEQALKILEAEWTSVEMNDGQPTEAAKQRRVNKVSANHNAMLEKFYADCDAVFQKTAARQNALINDINADYKKIAQSETLSSADGALTVSFGEYDGDKYGWNVELCVYSDGIMLLNDTFILKYESIAGKKAPDLASATDAQLAEYADNTDLYSSLFARGVPVITVEADIKAVPAPENKPSLYTLNISEVRAINTLTGKIVQKDTVNRQAELSLKPKFDMRGLHGVVAEEKEIAQKEAEKRAVLEKCRQILAVLEKGNYKVSDLMVAVPGQNFSILATEITQELYNSVMGENPSGFNGEKNLPVEKVSWYDAIVFCNRLSVKEGLKPVYSVDGVTNVSMWGYTPHNGYSIYGEIKCNEKANGYRLPTVEEWQYAAKGGQEFKYSGSDNLDEVAWYEDNSSSKTHPVAQKKENGYGLYDMSGNVWEWCWDSSTRNSKNRFYCGGSWYDHATGCEVGYGSWYYAYYRYCNLGFRIVRNIDE